MYHHRVVRVIDILVGDDMIASITDHSSYCLIITNNDGTTIKVIVRIGA